MAANYAYLKCGERYPSLHTHRKLIPSRKKGESTSDGADILAFNLYFRRQHMNDTTENIKAPAMRSFEAEEVILREGECRDEMY